MRKENKFVSLMCDESLRSAKEWFDGSDKDEDKDTVEERKKKIKETKMELQRERRALRSEIRNMTKEEKRIHVLRCAFRIEDIDVIGKIDRDGFERALARLGIHLHDVENAWKDRPHDEGLMDFESFNRWVQTRLKSHHRGFYHPDVVIARTRVFTKELFRQLIGRALSDAARRRIILKRKIEVAKAERNVFRQEHVAPLHSCPKCMRGFVSAWHLKDHESRKPSELYCEEEDVCYNHLKLFDENDVRQVRRECRRVEKEARENGGEKKKQ